MSNKIKNNQAKSFNIASGYLIIRETLEVMRNNAKNLEDEFPRTKELIKELSEVFPEEAQCLEKYVED